MEEQAKKNWLPPARSGFVEGKCPKCGRLTFSKGKVIKHRCKD